MRPWVKAPPGSKNVSKKRPDASAKRTQTWPRSKIRTGKVISRQVLSPSSCRSIGGCGGNTQRHLPDGTYQLFPDCLDFDSKSIRCNMQWLVKTETHNNYVEASRFCRVWWKSTAKKSTNLQEAAHPGDLPSIL